MKTGMWLMFSHFDLSTSTGKQSLSPAPQSPDVVDVSSATDNDVDVGASGSFSSSCLR